VKLGAFWPGSIIGAEANGHAARNGLTRPSLVPLCYILCVMERVGVRELRQNLSVYLRRVRRGEALEVTERGEPVAVLQPIAAADDPIAGLVARGITVRRGKGSLTALPPAASVRLDRPVSEVLDDLREDRI